MLWGDMGGYGGIWGDMGGYGAKLRYLIPRLLNPLKLRLVREKTTKSIQQVMLLLILKLPRER
jgi:hypothetical protein